jgi:hypothetical protein
MRLDIAGGSIAGHAHVMAGRNNQDAFDWARAGDDLVAVVCDGCGSGARSEVGAAIGARLIVETTARLFGQRLSAEGLLDRVRSDVMAELALLARAMAPAGRFAETVVDHFLFTVVGVLADAEQIVTFALGDGLIVLDGERRELGPYPNNEPPYLGYELLDPRRGRPFEVHTARPRVEVRSVVLGTDGALELADLRQFWEDDRYFGNPDMIRRRLTVLNRSARLGDDTTLVVIRS